MPTYATILATGRYVPSRTITNAELETQFGQPLNDWLVKNVGISTRHIMADEEKTSDLAVAAAKQALARACLDAADLDLVIVASDTPDYLSPGTASVVQAKLAATSAGTFDVNCACASFVTALDIGRRYIQTDETLRYILIVGAYGISRYIDWKDKHTATLFADGAGAVILGRSSQPGLMATSLKAEGSYHDALGIYTGGTSRPATPKNVAEWGAPSVKFVRKFPPTFNTEHWPVLVREVVQRAELRLDDIQLFVFTQLNLRTIESMMEMLQQPLERTHWIMDKWGYTGSACIPMALDDALEQGRIRYGDHVVLCASGGGIAMAGAVLRWTGGQ